jgi:hypothetical protein
MVFSITWESLGGNQKSWTHTFAVRFGAPFGASLNILSYSAHHPLLDEPIIPVSGLTLTLPPQNVALSKLL